MTGVGMPSGPPRPAAHRWRPPRRPTRVVALVAVLVAAVADCSSAPLPANLDTKATHQVAHAAAAPSATPTLPQTPARPGEWFVEMRAKAPYRPSASTGTDDYHCFLMDPGLASDALVSGVTIVPGNPNLVHHVIVHQVTPDQLAAVETAHAGELDSGWTCFGGNPIGGAQNLERSSWLAGWAPGQGERLLADDLGMPLSAGAKLIVQVHYNTLKGTGLDQTLVRLRLSPAQDSTRKTLRTMLVPAPVELPCRDGVTERLCDRESSLLDLMKRTGDGAGTADLLHLICGPVSPGPVQSCTRPAREPMTIRAVAGHMHLLGRSITVDVDKGTDHAQRVLDIPVWDFDNQGAIPLPTPVTIEAGHTITVTCEHDQSLRDRLPAFAGQKERYVTWGDGTTDEMCLGIVLWHQP